MTNHGLREAALAEELCTAAGLRRLSRLTEPGLLSRSRAAPAVLSCWTRS